MKFNIACIQNCATDNLDQTIQDCEILSREAYDAGADLICLPEFFSFLNLNEEGLDVAPFRESEHPTLAAFRELSLKLQVWILLGSIAIYDSQGEKRNRSILLNPEEKSRFDTTRSTCSM